MSCFKDNFFRQNIIFTPPFFLFRTCFNIVNQPDSLGLLEAKSPEDYNSLGELRAAVYSWVQHVRKLKIGSLIPAEQNAVYNIEVETGDREHSGTDATITIRITGIVHVCLLVFKYVRVCVRMHLPTVRMHLPNPITRVIFSLQVQMLVLILPLSRLSIKIFNKIWLLANPLKYIKHHTMP
jgi:hypothetical protein